MSDQLKPCPLCGGEADLKCTAGEKPDWFVQCTECQASVDVFGPGKVGSWNDRLPTQEQVVQKYDDTLLPFFALMRKELHANAGKGDRPGWLQMSADTCLLEIIYHFGKLQKAVKKGDGDGMNEYAADVANMCMMLLDICGALGLAAAEAPLRKS